MACAVVLYCWGMSGSEYNSFYASAARSMAESWKAFLFGSVSPANAITIDKIPGYLWPQALSARIFGFRAWSLVLPQIIEGLVTLLVTYRLVRRWAGQAAAVLAAGFLVLTPALIAMGHTNNEEAAYVMCLVLAASATQRAAVSGRLRSLAMAGVWVGLAFQCKMVEAWAVLPVIAVTYLVAAPPKLTRRLLHVLVAGLVTLAVSLTWVVVVALVPANSRPYIDGTTNNNPFSMVFGYNALTRFGSLGINPASVGAVSQARGGGGLAGRGTPPAGVAGSGAGAVPGGAVVAEGGSAAGAIASSGLATMFKAPQASQVGWLYLLAAVSIGVLLWQRRRKPRTDPVRAGVIMWTAWIVIYGLVYSAGTIHSYYVVTLAPGIAALSGAGTVALWRAYRAGGLRAWALPVTVALADAWAIYIASGFPTYRAWLIPVLAAAGIVALAALAVPRLRLGTPRPAVLADCILGLLAVSVGPAAWESSVITAGDNTSLATGTVGPSAPSAFGGAAAAGAGFHGSGAGFGGGLGLGGSASQGGAGAMGGMWVADGTLSTQQRGILDYAQAHRDGARFVLTVPSVLQAAPYVLRAGADVLSLGGFSGQVPYPTLAQFEQYVTSGQVRYVYLATLGSFGGLGEAGDRSASQGRQQTTAAQIEAWVPAHCPKVPASAYGGGTALGNSGALYACSGS